MEDMSFRGESFSEMEMRAAEQLMQLSGEDTTTSLSCSSGTSYSVCVRGETKRQEEEDVVVSSVGKERNDGVLRERNVLGKRKIKKQKKYRSLARIYRMTKEMTRD